MKRIFSGIQPSGELHIGNYLGAIKNWVKLLDEYDCIFCIVDYHAITIDYDIRSFRESIFDAALVNIASGLEPGRCTLFVQSEIPEHTELTWIFNCITPIGELSRMTQFKDKSKQHQQNINMGLMDYPVLQAADILLYKAGYVPVGKDQVQHIEFSREVARKFNNRFGEVFPEPQAILSKIPRVMGMDGKNKMSKSLNNYIGILEDPEPIWEKLKPAMTDENRKRRSDPGDPEICNIHTLHQGFSSPDEIEEIEKGCRSAQIGCIDCKKILWENLIKELEPIRVRASELRDNPGIVHEMLSEGTARCSKIAQDVMDEVRHAIGIRAK
jgi:tryptophanyl-tRNA synthetase